MFKLTVLAVVLAVANSQPERSGLCLVGSFVNRCSLSDPHIDECFVKNGNIAIEELNTGFEELQLVNLNGFDFGDVFLGLGEDLSFLLEDIKGYQKGVHLDTAHLHFATNKTLKRIDLQFSVIEAVWFARYRALGFVGNQKVHEKGDAQIGFGNVTIKYQMDFRRKTVEGVAYLKAKSKAEVGKHDKFEFLTSNVKGPGVPLVAEQFAQLDHPVSTKALEIILEYFTFVFNQIMQEIPADSIFLP